MSETDPNPATQEEAPRRRRRVKRKVRLGEPHARLRAAVQADTGPDAAERPDTAPETAAAAAASSPHRRRVRRRATSPFHISRRRQQIILALALAGATAFAVAHFVGASLDNPEAYVPGGAVH